MKIVQSENINHLEKQFITKYHQDYNILQLIIKITIYYNLSLILQLIIKHQY